MPFLSKYMQNINQRRKLRKSIQSGAGDKLTLIEPRERSKRPFSINHPEPNEKNPSFVYFTNCSFNYSSIFMHKLKSYCTKITSFKCSF